MNIKQIATTILPVAIATLLPAVAYASGGNPIETAGQSGVDMAVGLGPLAATAGIIGTCAGGMVKSMGIVAGGMTVTALGGAWCGAPELVQKLFAAASGLSLSDLSTTPLFFTGGLF